MPVALLALFIERDALTGAARRGQARQGGQFREMGRFLNANALIYTFPIG